jgi:excisionase family DNA binding protein
MNINAPSHPHRLALSMDEAAEALGVRRTTVTKLVYRGDLPSFKIGARRLVAEADLVRFVERRVAGDDQAGLAGR